MAIRWSKKARRFYDDQTGHPVSRTRGFLSSIGRRDYQKYHSQKQKRKKRAAPKRVGRREVSSEISEGYTARPLAEEFAEELEEFDGYISAGMSFEEYLEEYETEVVGVDSEDSYSED